MGEAKRATYVLEHAGESKRLESQAAQDGYRLEDEFRGIPIRPGEKVLDAGCGTGLVPRYLAQAFPKASFEGCDRSSLRLADAKRLSTSAIRYFESDLESIQAPDSSYDVVTSRYVIEHLLKPTAVAQEFFRILRPGGRAWMIDFDGMFQNLHPMTPELARKVSMVRTMPGFDPFAGRKILDYLAGAGFVDLSWRVDAVAFQGSSLVNEEALCRQRIDFALPVLAELFGSQAQALRFREEFCEQMLKPSATLFYNKFVVSARKP